jgi:hypothetical protein
MALVCKLDDIANVLMLIPQASNSIVLAWADLCDEPWADGWLQEIPSITQALSSLINGIGNQLEKEVFKNGSVRKGFLPEHVKTLLEHPEHRDRFEPNRGWYSCKILGDIVVREVTKNAARLHTCKFREMIAADVFLSKVYRETPATKQSCPGGGLVAYRCQHRHTAAQLYIGWNLNQLFGNEVVLDSDMMSDETMHKFAEQVESLMGRLWLISMAQNATSCESNDAAALLAIAGHVMIWITVWDAKCNPKLPRNSNFGLPFQP